MATANLFDPPPADKPTIIDRLFTLVVIAKGFDGVLETIGGAILIIVPVDHLHGWARAAIYELSESNHTVIAKYLSALDAKLTIQLALFAALFLLIHGIVKLGLVIALLSRQYRLYPAAIVVLLGFTFYQAYEFGRNPSAGLAFLTGVNIFIVVLTFVEWRRHRPTPKTEPWLRQEWLAALRLIRPKVREARGWAHDQLAEHPEVRRILLFALAAVAFLGGGVALALSLPQATKSVVIEGTQAPTAIAAQYGKLSVHIGALENRESQSGIRVVDDAQLQGTLVDIQLDVAAGRYSHAHATMSQFDSQVSSWLSQLDRQIRVAGAVPVTTDLFIPIVLYHYPPPDLDQQLYYLLQHGYTTITMSQVADAMNGLGGLPAKPVVITFDDGFANQMQAYDLLQKYGMHATFYIITGGEGSHWCIGAGRRYNDPSQPAGGCGDAYLTWDQVRTLDRSGLVEIGSHTVDHEDLGSETPERQQYEIDSGKSILEAQIGHPVASFAYPYGSYSQTTIDLVHAAGFTTAVTTLPGDYQSPGSLYTLHRIRDTLELP